MNTYPTLSSHYFYSFSLNFISESRKFQGTNMSSSEEPIIEDEEVEEEETLLNNNDDDDDDNDDDEFSRILKRVTINHGDFSNEEKRVADILLQLPELIRTCPRVSLNQSWLFKKTRSGINILSPPPPSPQDHDTIDEVFRLTQELRRLMEQNNILNLELKKVSSYHEKQRVFNLLLKETKEMRLQGKNPKASSNTLSNKVELDHSPLLSHLGDEVSSTKIEAHHQNQEKRVAGGEEGSRSLKLEQNHQVLQFDYKPSSVNGPEAPDQRAAMWWG